MATVDTLVARVRTELGDTGRSFVYTHTFTPEEAGGKRFVVPFAPVDGAGLTVVQNNVDVSSTTVVEEAESVVNLVAAAVAGQTLLVTGTHYRYFTNAELATIVNEAFTQHTYHRTDAFNRAITFTNLASVEEYPVALLATINALWVLATDSAFDIDIMAPDGVTIPRSERYRQLMELVQVRRQQYRELCEALNIGLDRIEVFTLRRISKKTNRYVPVYRPQEIDDRTPPARVYLAIPTYGAEPVPSSILQRDFVITQGDDFVADLDFSIDTTNYTVSAQVRTVKDSPALLASFTITTVDNALGTHTMSLDSRATARFPLQSFWDVQLTNNITGDIHTYAGGNFFTNRQVTVYGDDASPNSGGPYPPLLYGSSVTGFRETL